MSTTSAIQPTSYSRHRFHLLDALRGVAALFVLLWHIPTPFISNATHRSYLAVDFFFCLSGFVIAFSYEHRLADLLTFKDFVVARIIRLYPIYLLGIALGVADYLHDNPLHLSPAAFWRFPILVLLQLSMLPNFIGWNKGFLFPFDPNAWSLFYEILANLGFALLVRFRLAKAWLLSLLVILSFLLLVLLMIRLNTLDIGWGAIRSQVASAISRVVLSFSMGVLMLRLFRKTQHLHLQPAVMPLLAIAITLTLCALLQTPLAFMRSLAFQILAIALIFPALIYMGAFVTVPKSWTGVCVFFGDISYPLYLIPPSFVEPLHWSSAQNYFAQHSRLALFVVPSVLFFSALASYLAYRFYDEPLRLRLTRRYKNLTANAPPVPRPQPANS